MEMPCVHGRSDDTCFTEIGKRVLLVVTAAARISLSSGVIRIIVSSLMAARTE